MIRAGIQGVGWGWGGLSGFNAIGDSWSSGFTYLVSLLPNIGFQQVGPLPVKTGGLRVQRWKQYQIDANLALVDD